MNERSVIETFFRRCDRRSFLRAFGAMGVGLVAGGAATSVFRGRPVGRGLHKVKHTRVRMGTYVTMTSVDASRTRSEDAIEAAFAEMDRLIGLLSRHDGSSPLFVLNSEGTLDGPPPELVEVLRVASHFCQMTDGAFDVTVKPLVDLFNDRFAMDLIPTASEIGEAVALVSMGAVKLAERRIGFDRSGMSVTLDGIAKGYIVDRAAIVFESCGVRDFLIDAGGDIRCRSTRGDERPWRIAVEDPAKKRDYPEVFGLTTSAVATSGNYESFFDEEKSFHHIVDPGSGVSPIENASTSVIASSTMLADALSTATMVLPGDRGLELINSIQGVDCLLIGSDGNQRRSNNLDLAIRKVV